MALQFIAPHSLAPSALAGAGRDNILQATPEFLEMLPVAIYACDAAGRLLWCNSQAVRLWGRAPRLGDDTERFCGSYKVYRVDGAPMARAETPMASVLRTGVPVGGAEALVERPDGSRFTAMVHIQPVKDANGTLIGAINCFHDVTDSHEMAAALRRKSDELEDFFENSPVAKHLVDADGTIVRANKAELDLLRYDEAEYVGHPITEFHTDPDRVAEILGRLSRGEVLDKCPARLKAKDGTIRHVLISSSARLHDGDRQHTCCCTVDVTESERARRLVAESEERLRALLDALPAAIYTTDADGVITYFNRACIEMSGREPIIGADRWCVTWKLFYPDGTPMPHEDCPMAIALRENRPVRGTEALAGRPDGTRIPFIPYPTPFQDSAGRLIGAVNMLVDVSERKQAEAHQKVLLDELNHRVKNNMQMLNALLRTAQRGARSEEARSVLGDAERRVAAMAAAQHVLYEANKPTRYEARDFLEAVCGSASQAFVKRVTIDLKEASGSLSNETAMPLALILNELLTNAAKYGVGAREGVIRVGLQREEDSFVLYVEDDGPGFDPQGVHDRGSGLGLVQGLARQLGGQFEVRRNGCTQCVVRFAERGVTVAG